MPELQKNIVFHSKVSSVKQHRKGVVVKVICNGMDCPEQRKSGERLRSSSSIVS